MTDVKEKSEEQIRTKETDKSPNSIEPQQQSALLAKGTRKSVKSPQRASSKVKEKSPFVLYGWGERQMNTGSQKTHNVCASAPVHEVGCKPCALLPSGYWGKFMFQSFKKFSEFPLS